MIKRSKLKCNFSFNDDSVMIISIIRFELSMVSNIKMIYQIYLEEQQLSLSIAMTTE